MMGFNGSGVLGRIASGFGSGVPVENEVSDIATGVSPVRTGSQIKNSLNTFISLTCVRCGVALKLLPTALV